MEQDKQEMNKQGSFRQHHPDAMDQKRKVQKYFDSDRGWQGGMYREPSDWFSKTIVRRKHYTMQLVKDLQLPPDSTVLDIGFGSGAYLEELASLGYRCTGIDASEEMIRTTRSRLDEQGLNDVPLFYGDIENLPFRDSSFDLVLSMGVLGYLLNEQKAASEVRRILKPGGNWIVNVANGLSMSNIDFYLRKRILSMFMVDKGNAAREYSLEASFPSPWVENNSPTGHQYRLFHPRRFERGMTWRGFGIHSTMTFGFQLRLLRRVRFLPQMVLDLIEAVLERSAIHSPFSLMRYAGDSYTAVLIKQDPRSLATGEDESVLSGVKPG